MDTLHIDSTITTPELDFNPNTLRFELKGECRPENVLTFFTPVMDWLEDFKSWVIDQKWEDKQLKFEFKLEYYNSSSAKFIFNIFRRLSELKSKGLSVLMIWYYDELDEDLLETGQELEKLLNIEFKYVALKED